MSESSLTRTTIDRLLDSATVLFSKRWYSEVSVADICRTAGVSNGIFYRYYRSKEAIFRELIERYLAVLTDELMALAPSTGVAGLRQFIDCVFRVTDTRRELVSIFREGQYRFYEYERRLSQLYSGHIQQILGRRISQSEQVFVLAGTRFLAFRSVWNGSTFETDEIIEILTQGLFRDAPVDIDSVFRGDITPPAMQLSQDTLQRLLHAGRRLFGERGYHDVSIHEITHAARVGVGTFYNYFAGKEAFAEAVIDLISREIRSFIRCNMHASQHPMLRELRGMLLFSFYITAIDRSCYNIVREGEFVVPDAVRQYYDAFEAGYHQRPTDFPHHNPGVAANILMGISHYLGLELLYDGNTHRAQKLISGIAGHLKNGITMEDIE
ncbi:MAG: TetR/AcrR family transcriptional regulator [Spirochaetaceae bacterium]